MLSDSSNIANMKMDLRGKHPRLWSVGWAGSHAMTSNVSEKGTTRLPCVLDYTRALFEVSDAVGSLMVLQKSFVVSSFLAMHAPILSTELESSISLIDIEASCS